MRKILSLALAALTLAGGALSAGAADARDYRYYRDYNGRYYHRDRNDNDAAIVAGIAGLAIGAALASGGHDRYYDNGYYRRGYYDRGYYGRPYYGPPAYAYGYRYAPPPRRCRTTTFWDPYADAYIRRTTCW